MDRLRTVGGSSGFGPLFVFVVWALFLVCVVYLASAPLNSAPPWERTLSNWDSGWYLSIVEEGYDRALDEQSNVAFFPAYPLLVRWISVVGPDPPAAGVGLSLACFLAALFVLRRLLLERLPPETASNALLLTAFWFFSFFFALVYTESLFLLLATSAFLCAHKQRWWAAAACAGVASGTRVVGIFVALGVVLSFVQKEGWRPTRALVKSAGLAAVGVSGLAAFMAYLSVHTGSALAFLEVQRFWPDRGEGIVGLRRIPEVLTTGAAASYDYSQILLFGIPLLLFLGLSLFVLVRRDVAWGAFSLLTLLAPVPTGSLASTNRYVLILFPCFAALAELLKGRTPVVVAASAGLLGLFAYHYVFHPGIFVG